MIFFSLTFVHILCCTHEIFLPKHTTSTETVFEDLFFRHHYNLSYLFQTSFSSSFQISNISPVHHSWLWEDSAGGSFRTVYFGHNQKWKMHYFTHNMVVVFTDIFCSLSLCPVPFVVIALYWRGYRFQKYRIQLCSHTVLIVAETGKVILRSLMQLCSVAQYQTIWKKMQLCIKYLTRLNF